ARCRAVRFAGRPSLQGDGLIEETVMIAAHIHSLPTISRNPKEHDDYLPLMTSVSLHACIAFRAMPPVHRHEAVAEAVAAAFVSHVRLKERGKQPAQDFPSQ